MSLTPASIARLLWLAFAWPALASAQNVAVGVDATQAVRTVDERVFGLNAVIWDPQAGSTQTISLLQTAGLRAIRVPGGSLSDEYHWRTNTNLANTWTWSSGFNAFTQLITGLNSQAFATVNYGTGTPEEAAAWVAYANASETTTANTINTVIGVDAKGYDWKTAANWANLRAAPPLGTDDGMNFLRMGRAAAIGIKYWEIGNECYGTWETDQQALAHDPYTYAVRAAAYIAKMKSVDPSIKVGVVAVIGETDYANGYSAHPATNPRTGAVRNGWTPVMLATLKSLGVAPDFLIYHRYEQAPAADQPGNPETDAGLLQKAKTWPSDAANLRQQLTDYLGAPGAGVEIVVTENNSVYAQPGKQTTSLVNGLFLADSIGNVLQTEFNALMWWDTRNSQENNHNNSPALYGWRGYGDYGILSTPSAFGSTTYYEPYPAYYAMKLLQYFARGGDTVVRATSSSSLLSVFAAKRANGSLALLVINKDPTSTLSANIALTGHNPTATATVYSYGIPQDEAARTGTGSTDLATTSLGVSGTTFAASFAPYSATVISVSAASPWTFTQLQPDQAFRYRAPNGQLVGTVAVGSGHAAVWSESNPSHVDLHPSGNYVSSAALVSNGLQQTGTASPPDTTQNSVMLWSGSAASAVILNPPGFSYGLVAAMSATRQGGYVQDSFVSGNKMAALWSGTAASFVNLNPTGFVASVISAMNSTQQGGYAASQGFTRAALWSGSAASFVNLHQPTAVSNGVATSYDASQVAAMTDTLQGGWAHYGAGPFADHAGLWAGTAGSFVDLNPAGHTKSRILAMAGDYQAGVVDDRAAAWKGSADSYMDLHGFVTSGLGAAFTTSSVSGAYISNGFLYVYGTATDPVHSDSRFVIWSMPLPAGPPVFILQPQSQAATAGKPALLTAVASGSPAPAFQWKKNGTNINGATGNSYLLASVVSGDAGAYTVIATNSLGNVTSSAATLTVNVTPAFTLQPASQAVMSGNAVTFTAAASGTPMPTYQWQKDGVNISGATGTSYTILSVTALDTGAYAMVATNAAGSTTSSPATLTVLKRFADFNGDGNPDLLWQNSVSGERVLWLMNGTGVAASVSLGVTAPEWSIAAAADFNRDGNADILWQNTVSGERAIWLMQGGTILASLSLGITSTDWTIAATGDFNADGQPDILLTNTATGERAIWLMNGTSLASSLSLGVTPFVWSIAGTGDFNGDDQTDILLQNTSTGERAIWLMNGTTISAGVSLGVTATDWSIAGVTDLNADNKPDILLTNTTTGERSVWLMNGTTIGSTVSLGTVGLDWVLIRPVPRRTLADFNGDGKSDILWTNTVTGDRSLWLMNGTAPASGVALGMTPVEWMIAGTGDFNADGKADILWTNTSTGDRSLWLMAGTSPAAGVALPTTALVWAFAAIGDFNADGYSDIALTNTSTGERVIWLMNGTAVSSSVSLGVTPLAWMIAGAADFNGDGKSDLLLTNTSTGERAIWLMNGAAVNSIVSLGMTPLEWSIGGTGDFNGDGFPDIIWQNTATGDRSLWLMRGTTPIAGVALGVTPTAWLIRN